MNEKWEEAKVAEERLAGVPAEVEFEESGRPGCLAVFAVLLAVVGLVYSIVFLIAGLNLFGQPGRTVAGAALTLCALAGAPIPVILAIGLWRLRTWAWWLMVVSLTVGLGAVLLSFGAAFLGTDPAGALGFVLGPLMGILASGLVLYWFLTNRDRFGEEAVVDGGGRAEEGRPEAGEENALLIFAVTAIGCTALFCLVGVVLFAAFFVLGVPATLSGMLRSLGLPAP